MNFIVIDFVEFQWYTIQDTKCFITYDNKMNKKTKIHW